MAKKEKLQTDNFDLDTDFSFDDFNEDFVDSQINPAVKKGGRKPIDKVLKGTLKGAKDKAKDPSFIGSLVRKTLPSTYGEIVDNVDKVAGTASSLYDQAVRDLKPQAGRMAKRVDKLVPDEYKRAKKITGKIASFLGVDEGPSSSIPTKEQVQDQSVAIALAQTFGEQNDKMQKMQVERDTENRIQNNINRRVSQSSLSLLASMDSNITRLTRYNDKINQAVQKKSLELQYRQLFAMRDMTDALKTFSEVSRNQLEAIAKNTSLPEFVKINNSERFKDLARTKFIDKVQNSFFGEGSAIDRGLKKIKSDVGNYIVGIKNGLESASMGIDALEQVQELNATFRELGMEEISGAELAGNAAGGYIAEKIGDKITGKLKKKLAGNKKLNDALYRGANAVNNLPGTIDSISKSDKFVDAKYAGGMKGKLAEGAEKVFGYFSDGSPDTRINNPYSNNQLKGASFFNEKTQRALVDIIPGYLARILREVKVLRTGDDTIGLTYFSQRDGKFLDKKDLATVINKGLQRDIKTSGYGFFAENEARKFTEGENVSQDQKSKVTRFLAELSTHGNMAFTPENIQTTKAYRDLDPDTKKLVDVILDKKITSSDDKHKGQYEVTKNIMNLRNRTPDVRGSIETMINNGYGDILEEQGLVKRDDSGDYRIDEKAYLKMVHEHSLVTSDETKKEDIHPLSPKRALNAIRKTGIFNWNYKKGKGDGKNHNGPMAQDVQKTMGNKAAPGGKKLDLTTMNGNNMAAIQELADRQDNIEKGKKSGRSFPGFKKLTEDVSKIREAIEKSPFIGFGGGSAGGGHDGTYSGMIGSLLGAAGNLISKGTGDIFTLGKKGVDKAGELAKKSYENYKDPVKNAAASVFHYVNEATHWALDFGRKTIFGTIPEKLSQLRALGMNSLKKVGQWFNEVKDVYIPGKAEPALRAALIRAGYYRDSVTGKVIESMDDLANLKGNVVNRAGEVVLSIEDAAKGMYDQYGETVKTSFKKLADRVMDYGKAGFDRARDFWASAKEHGIGLFNRGKDKAGQLYDKAKGYKPKFPDMGMGFGFGGEKIYDVLVEIRDILGGKPRGRKGRVSRGGIKGFGRRGNNDTSQPEETEETTVETAGPNQPFVDRAKYKAGDVFGNLKDKYASMKADAPLVADKAMNKLSSIKDGTSGFLGRARGRGTELFGRLKGGVLSKGAALGGVLGSFFSDGDKKPDEKKPEAEAVAEEPKEKKTTKRKKKVKPVSERAFNDRDGDGRRDGSWEDRFDKMKAADEAARSQKKDYKAPEAKYKSDKSIMDTVKGIGGVAMNLFSSAKNVLGIGMSAGSLIGKLGLGLSRTLLGGARGVAAIGGLAGRALGGVGGVVQGAARLTGLARLAGVAETAVTVGSLMTGGVGSVIMGGLSAIGGIISSPVVLGAIAVAAAGYGIYKLYKYATRDNVDEFEDVRMKQYGIGTGEADKKYNHFMLVLEEYLQDGRMVYGPNGAYLNDKKVKPEELLEIFNIDKADVDGADKFKQWFQFRFKPFFLTNATALYAVDPKSKLKDVKDLKQDQQLKYLNAITFESGPYKFEGSPFKDLPRLNTNPDFALNAIKNLVAKVSKGQQKDLQKVKPGDVKPNPLPKLNAKPNTPPEVPDQKNLKENKAANSTIDTTPGEDGLLKDTPATSMAKDNSSKVSKAGLLKVADGAVRDGANGMQYIRLGTGVKIDSMNPSMLKNLLGMAQEYGEKTGNAITITSGTRTTAEQADLYRKYPGKAARPGTSMHEFGLAVDVSSGDLDQLDDMGLMRKYGFTRPVGGEPWHMEAAGIQTNIARAKKDDDFATMAVQASLFKGGSGVGSDRSSPMGKRDAAYAISLLDGSSVESVKDKIANKLEISGKQIKDPYGSSSSVPEIRTASNDSSYKTDKSNIKLASYQTNLYKSENSYAKSDSLPDVEPKAVSSTSSSQPVMAGDDGIGGDVKSIIRKVSQRQNVNPNDMMTFAAMESSLDPNARAGGNSSASGLYGFTNNTWDEQLGKTKGSGLSSNPSPFNPNDATVLASSYYKMNAKFLSGVKKNVSLTDVYLAHFLGPSGARKLLSADPNDIAANVLPGAASAKGNRPYFYDGNRPRTVAEFYKMVDTKLSKKAKEFGINYEGGSTLGNNGYSRDRNSDAPPIAVSSDSGYTPPSRSSSTSGRVAIQQDRDDGSIPQVVVSRPRISPRGPAVVSDVDRSGRGTDSNSSVKSMDSINTVLEKSLLEHQETNRLLGKILENSTSLMDLAKNWGKPQETAKPVAQPKPQLQAKAERVVSPVDLSRKSA